MKTRIAGIALVVALVLSGCWNAGTTTEPDDPTTEDPTATPPWTEPPDTTPPSEVTNFDISAGDSMLTLTWSDPPESDFDRVVVSYKVSGGAYSVFTGTIDPTGTVLQPLLNDTPYVVKVQTVDAAGNSSSGRVASGTPTEPDTTPPVPVSGVVVTVSLTYIWLTWSQPTDAHHCEVWYGISGQTQTLLDSTNLIGSGLYTLDTSFSYDFTLYAIDAAGNRSDPVAVTSLPYDPGGTGTGSLLPGQTVDTTIVSDFDGLAYGNLYKSRYLGIWWIQTYFYTRSDYAFWPDATFTNNNGVITMTVEGIASSVTVEELVDAEEATITSDFDGLDQGNSWTLDDGRTVTQTEFHYEYHYAYRPGVVLYTRSAQKYMYVEEMKKSVRVSW